MSKLKEGYIRYSNEEQRKAAIMQAESLGYKEWEKNRKYQKPSDNCIVFRGIDGEWNDELCTEITEADFYEIPLDAKEYDKAMTNTEKQALLFKLEQDKELVEKNLDWLTKQEIKARTAIYAALRTHERSSSILCLELAEVEAQGLFEKDINFEEQLLDSIEKHIEELEAG